MWEWCLDWYTANGYDTVTSAPGFVNANGKYLASSASTEGENRVARGGNFNDTTLKEYLAGNRDKYVPPYLRDRAFGFRVACRAGLD